MPIKDAVEIKERMIGVLKRRGPSLPVHIANEVGMSILFTSAFLSELFSEKKIKMSDMRVGSSPVYFLEENRPLLENFSHHLKSKEKEAFLHLKERKILKDSEQEPAIRVALRAIKDFAIPFKNDDEFFWGFFTLSEADIKQTFEKSELKTEKKQEVVEEKIPEKEKLEKKELEKEIEIKIEQKIEEEIKPEIHEKISTKKTKKEPKKKKTASKSIVKKQDDKFFNKIKEYLSKKSIDILGVEDVNKNEFVLRVKKDGEEQLLIAYNKKKISEEDIIHAYKKASELNLKYTLLSLGESSKKIGNLVEAIKKLGEISSIGE